MFNRHVFLMIVAVAVVVVVVVVVVDIVSFVWVLFLVPACLCFGLPVT